MCPSVMMLHCCRLPRLFFKLPCLYNFTNNVRRKCSLSSCISVFRMHMFSIGGLRGLSSWTHLMRMLLLRSAFTEMLAFFWDVYESLMVSGAERKSEEDEKEQRVAPK
ncbi:unnamed protein product [Durusdinium trenchii]|uniref:Uncharacterized protein n=1 Tax=Durusdinium trenchii TaxID=1381693 RepID=A0ABP0MHE8_9DINO